MSLDKMTLASWAECRLLLKDLGWTHQHAANRMGVDLRTVQRWVAEDAEANPCALAYLRLVRTIRRATG